jgi:hypothetical protein
MFNIITPFERYEYVEKVSEMLASQEIIWHVITDLNDYTHIDVTDGWINHYLWPSKRESCCLWKKYQLARNWLLDQVLDIKDDEYYQFLYENDALEPGYYDTVRIAVEDLDAEIIVTSSREWRGDVVATKEYKGSWGLEQLILKGSLINKYNYRFPIGLRGDELFARVVTHSHPEKIIFVPDAHVWPNFYWTSWIRST